METAGGRVAKIGRGQTKRRKHKLNRGFIVLQTQLAFSLGSRSQKVILDSEVMHSSVFQESQIRTNVIEPFPKQNKTMSVSERVM